MVRRALQGWFYGLGPLNARRNDCSLALSCLRRGSSIHVQWSEPQLISATRPFVRCRCLYEIGFTPQDKLTLLTHGFDKAAIADAFDVINVAGAQAWLAHCPHSTPALRAFANPKP